MIYSICTSSQTKTTAIILSFSFFMHVHLNLDAQKIVVGEVIFVSESPLKAGKEPGSLQAFMEEITSRESLQKGIKTYALPADRGNRKGEVLLTSIVSGKPDRETLANSSPFTDELYTSPSGSRLSDFLSNPEMYTEYQLIGAKKLKSLPETGMLGIHYIKVKPELAGKFEKLVVKKLHPAVSQLLPDMQLLYYKGVRGKNSGSYITIFCIESIAARERFWPTGGKEQEIVKKTFGPLNDLARELGTYLVEGSYLAPESGGAAAYWESREWTDFVYPVKK